MRRIQTGLLALFVILSLCSTVVQAIGTREDGTDEKSPVFSEMKSKLFKNLASMIMNGEDGGDGGSDTASVGKAATVEDQDVKPDVAKVAQAAAQQQAYYDAYMFNMMRFREAQAAAMMHRQRHKHRHRHKKGQKAHAKHKHKHRRHRMRFRQQFSPFPMMTPQSYYQQYYSHPRFRQMMPGMAGGMAGGMPGMMGGMPMGPWPDPDKEAFGDPEDDDDEDEKHHNKDKDDDDDDDDEDEEDEDKSSKDKEAASDARFREVLDTGDQAMHSQGHGALAYGDPMNSPTATAPRVETPSRIGGMGGAYSPPVPHASAGATGTRVAHPMLSRPAPNANAYAAMRFRSNNAPAAAPGKPDGNPNPTGVPMPMYAPTQAPPPAPNQVPAPASMIGHQIFPQNMQMANGRKYMPVNPPVTQQQISHMPQAMNPTTTSGQYPFSSFLQIDQRLEDVANAADGDIETETLAEHPQAPVGWYNIPRGTVAREAEPMVHSRLVGLALHPHRMYVQAPLLKEHTEKFPLL